MSEASASHSEALDESQRAVSSTQNDDDDDEDDALGAALFADEDEDANDDVAPGPATTAEDEADRSGPEQIDSVPAEQDAEQESAAEQDQEQDNNIKREDDDRTRIIMGLMTDEQIDRLYKPSVGTMLARTW